MTTRLSNEAPREWRPVAEPSADHSPFGSCASSWQSLERKRPSVSREAAAQVAWKQKRSAQPSADSAPSGAV